MIEAYLLTERTDEEAEKLAELCGKEYEPATNYIQSFINLDYVMRIIPQDGEDLYLLSFPDEDVICKIDKNELLKIQKG